MIRTIALLVATHLALALHATTALAQPSYVNFEAGHVRPMAIAGDGSSLLVVDTPGDALVRIETSPRGFGARELVRVGLSPVSVAIDPRGRAWVVNHVSDSISVVDLGPTMNVIATLPVADEPSDVVFAGPDRTLAFVTVAHRGQNSGVDSQDEIRSVGRLDLWVFDVDSVGAGSAPRPLYVLNAFGDTGRALEVSNDGRFVYAAVFHSGNGTTTVAEQAVCDGGAAAPPCVVSGLTMPGGLPAPNANYQGIAGPETGLIVRGDPSTGVFRDELGRDWSNAVPFELPDFDVFVFDTAASPPTLVASHAGVGTILYDLAIHPTSGRVFVAATEALNHIRFEPVLRGRFVESIVTALGEGGGTTRLDSHLDFGAPWNDADRRAAISLPVALAFDGSGERLLVAGYGSGAIFAYDVATLVGPSFDPRTATRIDVTGRGPSAIAVDPAHELAYVTTRFDDGVSIVDLRSNREAAHTTLYDPEPSNVRVGRPLFFESGETGYGEASCGSCHVFGHDDALAWDLGNPNGDVVPDTNPVAPAAKEQMRTIAMTFHPLKGPMTTQTIRGIGDSGLMHWRGDRVGADISDARDAVRHFNPAFVSLLGRDAPLSDGDLERFADFALSIAPPPNPHAPLDGTLTQAQQDGRTSFFGSGCPGCHAVDPSKSHYGTNYLTFASTDSMSICASTQPLKVPSLRQLYQKVGRGASFPLDSTDPSYLGPQIRGFGLLDDGHRGATNLPVATPYLVAFPSNFAPIVGQQITITASSPPESLDRARLFVQRAETPFVLARGTPAHECDLIASANFGGGPNGLLYRNGVFLPDRTAALRYTFDQLLAWGRLENQPITFTCAVPGTGWRAALDADLDGFFDGDERDAGTDPYDRSSSPNELPQPSERCSVEAPGTRRGAPPTASLVALAAIVAALGRRRRH